MAGSTTDAEALARQLLGARIDYAPWLDRERCRRVVAGGGLPGHHSESWRHTKVAHWYRAVLSNGTARPGGGKRIETVGNVQVADFANPRAARLAGEHFDRAFDFDAHPLAAVNRLLLDVGVVVRVRAAAAAPVVIGDLGGDFQHVLIRVDAGACVVVVEEPSRYAHRIVEIAIAPGARVQHRRRQAAAADRHECSLVSATVARQGSYSLAQSSLGAPLRRNDIAVTLAAGAEAHLSSAWRLHGGNHLDNQIAISHLEPAATSRQIYRGIASDHATAILNGRIHIAPGAHGSDAALSTKNLIAGGTAQVFAKPVLEIHASDVKCSHGATVGTLDEAAIHYLRSRGIGEPAARLLLMRGFLREAIDDQEGGALLGLGVDLAS